MRREGGNLAADEQLILKELWQTARIVCVERKITIFAAMLCWFAGASQAWEWEDGYTLTDLGKMKVVLLNGTQTKDGAYALGWTVRAADKKTPPVNWSRWDKNEPGKFLEVYVYNDQKPNPYEYVDCVVDLRDGKIMEIPQTYFANVHTYLGIAWSPEENGRRFALVENRGRHEESNIWLIEADGAKMRLKELYPALRKDLLPVLRDKRPYDYGCLSRGLRSVARRAAPKPSFMGFRSTCRLMQSAITTTRR